MTVNSIGKHMGDAGVSLVGWGTAGLVPGMRIRMKSAELAGMLRDRCSYHISRAEAKQREMPGLKAAADAIRVQSQSNPNVSNSSNYKFDGDSAVEQLDKDIKDHRNKSRQFSFLAEHLFEDDYCLERSDLVALELIQETHDW